MLTSEGINFLGGGGIKLSFFFFLSSGAYACMFVIFFGLNFLRMEVGLPVFSLISHKTLNSAGFMRWQLSVCFLLIVVELRVEMMKINPMGGWRRKAAITIIMMIHEWWRWEREKKIRHPKKKKASISIILSMNVCMYATCNYYHFSNGFIRLACLRLFLSFFLSSSPPHTHTQPGI